MKLACWCRVSAAGLVLLLVSACAPLNRPRAENIGGDDAPRVCSPNPVRSVEIFLQGMGELSILLLASVIPSGVSIFSIFERGRETVRELVDHPEKHNGKDVGSAYSLISTAPESPGIWRALIRREVLISPHDKPEDVREESSRRLFMVFFDLGTNCITRVRSADTDWKPD